LMAAKWRCGSRTTDLQRRPEVRFTLESDEIATAHWVIGQADILSASRRK
jgi:hypothetical protein